MENVDGIILQTTFSSHFPSGHSQATPTARLILEREIENLRLKK